MIVLIYVSIYNTAWFLVIIYTVRPSTSARHDTRIADFLFQTTRILYWTETSCRTRNIYDVGS